MLLIAHRAAGQTVQDTLADAYRFSPQLQAEQALLRATDESVPAALANYRPSLSIFGEQGTDHVGGGPASLADRLDQFGNFSPAAYGLRLDQPIYRGGRTGAEASRAMNLVMAERAKLAAMEQSVLLGAVTDYYNVLQFQTATRLARENERVLAKYLDDTRGRFHSGAATGTDIAQAEAGIAHAVTERLEDEGGLAVAATDYQRDTGKLPGALALPDTFPELPVSEDDALAKAATDNPAVIAADFTAAAAEDDVDLARGQLLPTLSLDGVVQHLSDVLRVATTPDALAVGKGRSDEARIMLQLTIPIFDGGKAYAVSRQAQQIVSERASEADRARHDATAAAASTWEQLGEARALIASLKSEVKANEAAFAGVEAEARIGARSVFDVVTAEETLFRSEIALTKAQHDEGVTAYALAAATGGLSAGKLLLAVEPYDPVQHFEAVRNKWFGFGEDFVPRPAVLPAAITAETDTKTAPPSPAVSVTQSPAPRRPDTPEPRVAYFREKSVIEQPNESMDYAPGPAAQGEDETPEDYSERVARAAAHERDAARSKWMERNQDD